jgi:vacuolar-type H+-ATPase subunit H
VTGIEHDPVGAQAEAIVAVSHLERVLDERFDVRAEAEARIREAEKEAQRLVQEGREHGRAAAQDVRRAAIEAAERDAAELARQTEADIATLRAEATGNRQEAVQAILAAVLPRRA